MAVEQSSQISLTPEIGVAEQCVSRCLMQLNDVFVWERVIVLADALLSKTAQSVYLLNEDDIERLTVGLLDRR